MRSSRRLALVGLHLALPRRQPWQSWRRLLRMNRWAPKFSRQETPACPPSRALARNASPGLTHLPRAGRTPTPGAGGGASWRRARTSSFPASRTPARLLSIHGAKPPGSSLHRTGAVQYQRVPCGFSSDAAGFLDSAFLDSSAQTAYSKMNHSRAERASRPLVRPALPVHASTPVNPILQRTPIDNRK